MDNFSLRSLTAPMKMATLASADTQGARWAIDETVNAAFNWSAGVEFQAIHRNARRFTGSHLQNLQSLLWPDVQRDRYGTFAEGFWRPASTIQLSAGVRYDQVRMDADAVHKALGMATPAMLYQILYQTSDTRAQDDNWSGFVGSDWHFMPGQSLSFTLSQSVRSPDATERYLASWGMNTSLRWVGDPGLSTEKHHKAELAVKGESGAWHWQPSLWIDRVDDYALRTEQDSGPYSGTSIYRNISAELHGAELALGWTEGAWSVYGALATVHGENRADDRPLPQIPSLSLTESLIWHRQGQPTPRGVAAGPRPGPGGYRQRSGPRSSKRLWRRQSLGGPSLVRHLSLSWAIDNLFDKTWAPNVSRANTDPFSPEAIRVNEPGQHLSDRAERELVTKKPAARTEAGFS